MTDEEKIKVIESMGIAWFTRCPDNDYGLKVKCINGDINTVCKTCWIKALEE